MGSNRNASRKLYNAVRVLPERCDQTIPGTMAVRGYCYNIAGIVVSAALGS